MNFGEALESLKLGRKVSRGGWNGKAMWLELQRPDAHSKMEQPYIFITPCNDGGRVPWVASQPDMLEEDWEELT